MVIDDLEKGVFRVERRAFTDPGVLELEQQRVFNRSWLYAAYESEVPKPGDFCARDVGGRPLIIVRGSDGVVRAFFNSCPHRGARVCLKQAGATKTFQCPYHAWTFNNQGALIGVPGEDRYSALEKQELGLAPVPRIESYRGFVFVCFDPDAQTLVEYLAGARDYLDLVCDQSEVGMEIVRGTHLYCMRANWKLLVENSIDYYHVPTTHRRYVEYRDIDRSVPRTGFGRALGNGHAVVESGPPYGGRPIAAWVPSFGADKKAEMEATRARYEARFGKERADRITQTYRNLLIFPNLIIIDSTAITVRTFYPRSPDFLDITAWNIAPVDESASDRALRLDNFLTFFGPGGFATPDDVEMLESCQRGFAAQGHGWSDISRGMKSDPRPGDEFQIRTFWRRWNELMASPSPVSPSPEIRLRDEA